MEAAKTHWKNCSSCKKPINFAQTYYECSVSTCTGDRTGYAFCSVPCWERHLPGARHRDAGAVEKQAPRSADAPAGVRRIVSAPAQAGTPSSTTSTSSSMDQEILVVVSKMKAYISDKSGMNTSGDVANILSDRIRILCDRAVEQARADGRKTVMARDFK